jgi:adenylate cyclase
MWVLILRIAGLEPKEYNIKPGSTTIGRDQSCDVFINDPGSSREHALITYNDQEEIVSLYDLESTNGTFVNQQKMDAPYRLRNGDRIRIGSSLLIVKRYMENDRNQAGMNHESYTRELLSQAVDYHSALMYEVAQQLCEIVDINTGLRKIVSLMKIAMGADNCEIIMETQFSRLQDFQIPELIVQEMLATKTAILFPDGSKEWLSVADEDLESRAIRSAICVPLLLNKDIIGLIYLDKVQPKARNFDGNDIHLAVAISHQTALTIQRMNLMEQLSEETKIRQTLLRFVSPQETEYLLKDVLSIGQLPGLSRRSATILFADIAESTRLAEKLGAQKFGEILNQFYLDVTNIIFKYNGIVRYLGDGVMAIFLTQGETSTISRVAVSTGLEILRYVETSKIPVTIGVTIKSGEVVVGYVGNDERVEFTVLGDAVNVAHGMQSYARPNKLLVGPEIVDFIKLNKNYHLRPLAPIRIKHREGLVEVYEVLKKGPIDSDTIPISRMRSGTSELIRELPQPMDKDSLS